MGTVNSKCAVGIIWIAFRDVDEAYLFFLKGSEKSICYWRVLANWPSSLVSESIFINLFWTMEA